MVIIITSQIACCRHRSFFSSRPYGEAFVTLEIITFDVRFSVCTLCILQHLRMYKRNLSNQKLVAKLRSSLSWSFSTMRHCFSGFAFQLFTSHPWSRYESSLGRWLKFQYMNKFHLSQYGSSFGHCFKFQWMNQFCHVQICTIRMGRRLSGQ